ncbi:speckle-type POZ protein B-like [Stegodyphus dumicola]|uniref:speckle-type POZ protein B-like n=1 Tax=Stegodyphus dumicola TaxID=202533 RepID=UPI0015AE52F8|nr:speckle-type POZ protein B-like [Stegodyphus dumicola]
MLLLTCEFKLSNGSYFSHIVESSCVSVTSIGDNDLNRNLQDLYECGLLSDVTVVADSRRFSVHKFILCSQSSVFTRMFQTEMIESRTNQVEISDVDPHIIHEMLLFLYTGNLGTLCEESAMQLYTAADKYDVDALKKKCSSFLKSNITEENVRKILQLAEMHSDDDLYQTIQLEFFSAHAEECAQTIDN